ncbi:uncharacterized protein PFLUO_LOCUS3402 [Penicillium psychrofluorescens]|uniref:uncharacterized protein n=1 Tax=Penicillium psychrofluorescens TaxID=3158075 RepID=UPI003CCDFB5E
MISTIPPPRPVSVNSLARAPGPPLAAPAQKTLRSTSTRIPLHDNLYPADSSHSTPASALSYSSPVPHDISTFSCPRNSSREETEFANLPIEIHEAIIDHLFGERASAAKASKSSLQNWEKALRHPRRKALSNLSLISRVWTPLVQSRIYRHIKVKGTIDGLAECAEWFATYPHLAGYVRHLEVWIPVWGNRAIRLLPRPPGRRSNAGMPDPLEASMVAAWGHEDVPHGNNIHYYSSTQNATLDEIFQHVQIFFPGARVLTLEGGHCKNPPMIRHFRKELNESRDLPSRQRLPVLPNVQTFVMRGAWNLMRGWGHWYNLSQALPALREWHCAYAQPKPEIYFTMSQVLDRPPPFVRHLNISLEGFYNNKDAVNPALFGARVQVPPICDLLGAIAPTLETLAFTGKICVGFFDSLRQHASPQSSGLKSLDLVVKTCCRGAEQSDSMPSTASVSGITNINFICAFEALVIGAVECLECLPSLENLRIRFIDLDSTSPLLNPYFQLTGNECMGLWSYPILEALQASRPSAYFVELNDGIHSHFGTHQQALALYPRSRPKSIHVSTYRVIADASKI